MDETKKPSIFSEIENKSEFVKKNAEAINLLHRALDLFPHPQIQFGALLFHTIRIIINEDDLEKAKNFAIENIEQEYQQALKRIERLEHAKKHHI